MRGPIAGSLLTESRAIAIPPPSGRTSLRGRPRRGARCSGVIRLRYLDCDSRSKGGGAGWAVGSDQSIKNVEIWTDGKLSERVKAELSKRAIGYQSLSVVNDK